MSPDSQCRPTTRARAGAASDERDARRAEYCAPYSAGRALSLMPPSTLTYSRVSASVACTVGNAGTVGSVDGGDTTLTLPNGVVVTAGGGKSASNGGAGGVAIGGEASTPGLPAVSTTGGNAPDFGTFPGAPTNTVSGRQPGTGAGGSYISTIVNGGTGEIYVTGL